MDIGSIIIAVTSGTPRIVRCEAAPGGGTHLVSATNAAELDAATRENLAALGADLALDGLYPCPVHLREAAQFAQVVLPQDAITLAEAKDILYPGLEYKAAWARVHRDVAAGRLRAYSVGSASNPKRYVSRAEVVSLLDTPSVRRRGRQGATTSGQ